MQGLHAGANNEQPVPECTMWLEVFWAREDNRRVDSAEAGMTVAIADTLPATVVEQQSTIAL